MGMINVDIRGSFGSKNGSKSFSAMKHGHADAVAQAIEYLAKEVLPFATALDHTLHAEGDPRRRDSLANRLRQSRLERTAT